jgi:hypothetical protein
VPPETTATPALTADDRAFIIRALAMHAALTRTFAETPEQTAPIFEEWIKAFTEGAGASSDAPAPPTAAANPRVPRDA